MFFRKCEISNFHHIGDKYLNVYGYPPNDLIVYKAPFSFSRAFIRWSNSLVYEGFFFDKEEIGTHIHVHGNLGSC